MTEKQEEADRFSRSRSGGDRGNRDRYSRSRSGGDRGRRDGRSRDRSRSFSQNRSGDRSNSRNQPRRSSISFQERSRRERRDTTPGPGMALVTIFHEKYDRIYINDDFHVPQPYRLGDIYIWPVCESVTDNFEPCDWSTRFMRVISLSLSSDKLVGRPRAY